MPRIEGAYGLRLTGPAGHLAEIELPPLDPSPDHVVVEVAGCGLCHTDIGFAYDGVPTRHPLPLILGHEIAGRVIASGDRATEWVGRSVIVPAVIPCGACPSCAAGRPTSCRDQFMPGNDGDGGFATHVVVPARGLCAVPDELPPGITLEMLSVVADAVTTPYEAITRAEVGANDLVIVVGAGGIGGFGVQIAVALGATVIAVDVNEERLALAQTHGAALTMNPSTVDGRAMKSSVRGLARATGRGLAGWKIFEMSGTPAGQQTAFGLLDFGGSLAVVGYTSENIEIRLSNLMAYDATVRGNWGCAPDKYPAALAMVLEGKVKLEPYVERHALKELPELLAAVHRHEIRRRAIVLP